MNIADLAGGSWFVSVAALVVAILGALLVHSVAYYFAGKFTSRTQTKVDDSVVQNSRGPARLLLLLVAISIAMSFVHVPKEMSGGIFRALGIGFIIGIAWLFIAFTNVLSDIISARYDIHVKDNLSARRVQTQVHLLRRIVIAIVVVVALSAVLMTIPEIRGIGAGLFASAGIAGLVIGMAARPTLANLIAGVQLALTEPIRIDDVVIVEGEWGRIEEIRPTYVVVRIWDLRRLIVPLSYFMEQPFQNWTRQSADLLGTVFVYTDYTVPVEAVRQELHAILKSTKRWDGKAWGLQVTDSNDRVVELRALMSAQDSGTAWDLRCEVRERLINFLQREYPGALPRARAEILGVEQKSANSRKRPSRTGRKKISF